MKKIVIYSALFLITGNAIAQVDRSVRPKPGTAPTINIKDSEVFTTANGITVVLSENHKLPRVSLNLVMGSDPMMEANKAGLSDVAGQLIMSGTTNRSKDQLDQEIDYIGASINASSQNMSLACLTKHLPKAMELYMDILQNANFPQSEFDRIIKQNESNLMSSKSSPDEIASNVERRVNFMNHPYGEIMTEATLAAITRDDVVNYYKNFFTPTGSYLVIVGDINKAQATQLVDSYFANWKGGAKYEQDWGSGSASRGNRVIFVKKPGAVQSTITVTYPIKMKPGDANQVPLTVLNGIFGGSGFGTRLMQNLREDKAYTYGCYSELNITDNGSWFSASGNFRNDVSDSAIAQILYELDRITTGYVTDAELDLTKSAMAGSFARSLESPSTIARFALNIIQNKLPKDYYQTYLKRLAAVDKDLVLAMAQMYLTAKNCNIVVVGNEAIIEKLKVFDTDGKIEFLDAFAQEIIETKKADISKEQLIEKYILAVTATANMKAANKKLAKLKSVTLSGELKNAMFPGALSMTNFYAAPNKQAMKLEMNGMLLQKMVFDGKKGNTSSMQGGKEDFTTEEITARNKSVGYFPEANFATSGMKYELKGIETVNGKDYYVLTTDDGQSSRIDYFDTKTFMRFKTIEIDKGQETTTVYGDYKDVNGFLFPHQMTLSIGEMSMDGTVKSIEVNGKIEASTFE